jgi:hypothetical protein
MEWKCFTESKETLFIRNQSRKISGILVKIKANLGFGWRLRIHFIGFIVFLGFILGRRYYSIPPKLQYAQKFITPIRYFHQFFFISIFGSRATTPEICMKIFKKSWGKAVMRRSEGRRSRHEELV